MATPRATETQKATLLDYLNRAKIPLIALFLLLIVALIAFFIVMVVDQSRSEDAIEQIYGIETTLRELLGDSILSSSELPLVGEYGDGVTPDGELLSVDDSNAQQTSEADDNTKQIETLKQELKDVITTYPRQYGSIRARYLLAITAWDTEDYEEAFQYFDDIVTNFPSNYLAVLSRNAAPVALEELGRQEEALEYYQSLLEIDSSELYAPNATKFAIGRLLDSLGRKEEAYSQFEQLYIDDGSSIYAELAKTRMISLRDYAPEKDSPTETEE